MWKKRRVLTCTLLFLSIICSNRSDAACDGRSPPLLNDITVREPTYYSDYWTDGEGILLNDRELDAKWYSAVFNGRQYLMTDSKNVPLLSSCNTLYPYYLKDEHPSLDDLNDIGIEREACMVSLEETCGTTVNVRIRKCDKEIQYYLKPTIIYSAYCFGAGAVINDTAVPPPSDVNLGSIYTAPEIRFSETPVTNGRFKVKYVPFIQFRCIFSNSSDYFYNVQWSIRGKSIASYGPSQNMDDLSLHEDTFKDYPLGYMVQCSVAVSAVKRGQQTEPKYSDKYYAGVKIYNSTVFLKKGSHIQIAISSTLPIGCTHPDNINVHCKDELRISNALKQKCQEETLANIVEDDDDSRTKCTEEIKTLYKGARWDPNTLFHFKIVTTDMDYEDNNTFGLKLQFSSDMAHTFWKNKALPNVRVIVQDNIDYQNKTCYSHGDPHIRTADGNYYSQQQVGSFILYHNEKYNIEIQETTQRCGSAACTCGVSIRAGRDIFMINRCGKINFLGFPQCDDGGILQVVRINERTYKVFTPIGTKITLSLMTRFINIDILMAPKDKYNLRGLCGYFDNKKSNDMVHRDRTTSTINVDYPYTDFVNSWRVQKEEVYSRKKRDLKSWASQNGIFCVCEEEKAERSAEALCSSMQYLECPMQDSITQTKCYIHSHRKRRSPASHEKEMDRLFALMQPVENHNIRKRNTNATVISEDQAKEKCSKKIKGSLAFTSYRDMTASEDPNAVISQCIFDIMATNDQSFADAHADSVNTIVKGMMNEVPTYVETNKKEVQVFLKNSCSSNCSDRGNCSDDGECICHQFYHGAICDIDERIPPIVTDIEGGGVCDTSDGGDCRCFYVRGDNFLESLKCKIVTSEISILGDEINVTIETFAGDFEDVFTGVCCIPEENVFSRDMFVREHDVSVSSDGVHYGENNTMYIFDSTCQKLESLATGRPSFKLKNGFCFIEHACIKNTYAFLSENDTCLSCNTTVSVTDWTETNLEICIPTTTTTSTKTTKSCTSTHATEMTTMHVDIPSTEGVENQTISESTSTSTEDFENQTLPVITSTSMDDVVNTTFTEAIPTTETKQTTAVMTTSKKRCKGKHFIRLKERKKKLSVRNKKRKKKIERLTEQVKRLKQFVERVKSNRKNINDQTTTQQP
ncbi:uncharacterized protein LOC132755829 [Ruditapes philippinarum]|uniref:uncharacterized protein LOC132755829 n=1 Tax=Ruditapes philippinarum TaxID=129788 RepID=UPI00295ACACA|nr:uncharacterized protein LOC132755829 [Ruditapes philippinarum]